MPRWLDGLFGGSRAPELETKSEASRRATGGQYVAKGNAYASGWDVDRAVRDGYEKVIWVFNAIDAFAQQFADWDVICWEGSDKKTRKKVQDPLLELLNDRTNAIDGNAFNFKYRVGSQWLLSKKGVFVEVIPSRGGGIAALNLLPPGRTSPIPDPDSEDGLLGFELTLANGEVFRPETHPNMRVFDPKKPGKGGILWIKKPHPLDPYSSVTPLEAAGISIDLDFYARLYNRNFLLNDGRSGQLVAIKGGLNPEDAAEIKRRFSPGLGGVGRTTVIEAEGVTVTDTAVSPRDAQYAELRNITKEDLLMALKTPESVAGNASGRTFDNADAERENWLERWVITNGRQILSAFEALTEGGWDDDRHFDFDTSNEPVLQRQEEKRKAKADADFQAGRITLAEWREVQGLDPLPADAPGVNVVWLDVAQRAPTGDVNDIAAAANMQMLMPGMGALPGGSQFAGPADPADPNAPDLFGGPDAGGTDPGDGQAPPDGGGGGGSPAPAAPSDPGGAGGFDVFDYLNRKDLVLEVKSGWLDNPDDDEPFEVKAALSKPHVPGSFQWDETKVKRDQKGRFAKVEYGLSKLLDYGPAYPWAKVPGGFPAQPLPAKKKVKVKSLRKGDVVAESDKPGSPVWTFAGMKKGDVSGFDVSLVAKDGTTKTLHVPNLDVGAWAVARTPHPVAQAQAKKDYDALKAMGPGPKIGAKEAGDVLKGDVMVDTNGQKWQVTKVALGGNGASAVLAGVALDEHDAPVSESVKPLGTFGLHDKITVAGAAVPKGDEVEKVGVPEAGTWDTGAALVTIHSDGSATITYKNGASPPKDYPAHSLTADTWIDWAKNGKLGTKVPSALGDDVDSELAKAAADPAVDNGNVAHAGEKYLAPDGTVLEVMPDGTGVWHQADGTAGGAKADLATTANVIQIPDYVKLPAAYQPGDQMWQSVNDDSWFLLHPDGSAQLGAGDKPSSVGTIGKGTEASSAGGYVENVATNPSWQQLAGPHYTPGDYAEQYGEPQGAPTLSAADLAGTWTSPGGNGTVIITPDGVTVAVGGGSPHTYATDDVVAQGFLTQFSQPGSNGWIHAPFPESTASGFPAADQLGTWYAANGDMLSVYSNGNGTLMPAGGGTPQDLGPKQTESYLLGGSFTKQPAAKAQPGDVYVGPDGATLTINPNGSGEVVGGAFEGHVSSGWVWSATQMDWVKQPKTQSPGTYVSESGSVLDVHADGTGHIVYGGSASVGGGTGHDISAAEVNDLLSGGSASAWSKPVIQKWQHTSGQYVKVYGDGSASMHYPPSAGATDYEMTPYQYADWVNTVDPAKPGSGWEVASPTAAPAAPAAEPGRYIHPQGKILTVHDDGSGTIVGAKGSVHTLTPEQVAAALADSKWSKAERPQTPQSTDGVGTPLSATAPPGIYGKPGVEGKVQVNGDGTFQLMNLDGTLKPKKHPMSTLVEGSTGGYTLEQPMDEPAADVVQPPPALSTGTTKPASELHLGDNVLIPKVSGSGALSFTITSTKPDAQGMVVALFGKPNGSGDDAVYAVGGNPGVEKDALGGFYLGPAPASHEFETTAAAAPTPDLNAPDDNPPMVGGQHAFPPGTYYDYDTGKTVTVNADGTGYMTDPGTDDVLIPVDTPYPPPPSNLDAIYKHPQGKVIYVGTNGGVEVWGPDGKAKTTSATPEKLAEGYGAWKAVTPDDIGYVYEDGVYVKKTEASGTPETTVGLDGGAVEAELSGTNYALQQVGPGGYTFEQSDGTHHLSVNADGTSIHTTPDGDTLGLDAEDTAALAMAHGPLAQDGASPAEAPVVSLGKGMTAKAGTYVSVVGAKITVNHDGSVDTLNASGDPGSASHFDPGHSSIPQIAGLLDVNSGPYAYAGNDPALSAAAVPAPPTPDYTPVGEEGPKAPGTYTSTGGAQLVVDPDGHVTITKMYGGDPAKPGYSETVGQGELLGLLTGSSGNKTDWVNGSFVPHVEPPAAGGKAPVQLGNLPADAASLPGITADDIKAAKLLDYPDDYPWPKAQGLVPATVKPAGPTVKAKSLRTGDVVNVGTMQGGVTEGGTLTKTKKVGNGVALTFLMGDGTSTTLQVDKPDAEVPILARTPHPTDVAAAKKAKKKIEAAGGGAAPSAPSVAYTPLGEKGPKKPGVYKSVYGNLAAQTITVHEDGTATYSNSKYGVTDAPLADSGVSLDSWLGSGMGPGSMFTYEGALPGATGAGESGTPTVAPTPKGSGPILSAKAKAAAKAKPYYAAAVKNNGTILLPKGGSMVVTSMTWKPSKSYKDPVTGTYKTRPGGNYLIGTPSADADPSYLHGMGPDGTISYKAETGYVQWVPKAALKGKGATVGAPPTSDAPTAPPTTVTTPVSVPNQPMSTAGWTLKPGSQGGSNPGGIATDQAGKKWYVKASANPKRMEGEVLAARLYQEAGVKVPDVQKIAVNPSFGLPGHVGVASPWAEGSKKNLSSKFTDPAYRVKIVDGFAVDAWLANWDAVGTGKDNIVEDTDGNPLRIDVGGSLMFRAMEASGDKQADEWTDHVQETATMVAGGKNSDAAQVFGKVTKAELKASFVKHVAPITPQKIDELVDAHWTSASKADRDALKARLKARRADLAKQVGVTLPEDVVPDYPSVKMTGGVPLPYKAGMSIQHDMVTLDKKDQWFHTTTVGANSLHPGAVLYLEAGDTSAPYVVTQVNVPKAEGMAGPGGPVGSGGIGKPGVMGKKNGTGPEVFLFVQVTSSGERQVRVQADPPPGWKPPPPPPPPTPGIKLGSPESPLPAFLPPTPANKSAHASSVQVMYDLWNKPLPGANGGYGVQESNRKKSIENAYALLTPEQKAACDAAGLGTKDAFVQKFSGISSLWDGHSNDSDPVMLAFQHAAAIEFGLEDVAPWGYEESDMALKQKVAKEFTKNGKAYQAAARVIYQNTQNELSKRGVQYVWVRRKMSFSNPAQKTSNPTPPWAWQPGTKTDVTLRPLSSFAWEDVWSGNVWVEGMVPREAVFSIGPLGPGGLSLSEKEVVVLGVSGPGVQWKVTHHGSDVAPPASYTTAKYAQDYPNWTPGTSTLQKKAMDELFDAATWAGYPSNVTEDWPKFSAAWPFVDEDGDDVISVAELLDLYPSVDPWVLLTLPVATGMPQQLRDELEAMPDDEDGIGLFAAENRPAYLRASAPAREVKAMLPPVDVEWAGL